jgi:hypothetical protein
VSAHILLSKRVCVEYASCVLSAPTDGFVHLDEIFL